MDSIIFPNLVFIDQKQGERLNKPGGKVVIIFLWQIFFSFSFDKLLKNSLIFLSNVKFWENNVLGVQSKATMYWANIYMEVFFYQS